MLRLPRLSRHVCLAQRHLHARACSDAARQQQPVFTVVLTGGPCGGKSSSQASQMGGIVSHSYAA
jgi:hypothetical protein